MPISLYDIIIPTFIKGLKSFEHFLTKAEEHAKEKNLNADEVFVQAKLIDDQLPLAFQIQNATKAIQFAVGILTGVDPTFFENDEKTFADLHARIKKTVELLEGVKPEDVAPREDLTIDLPWLDKTLHITVKDAVLNLGQTNFFFHLATGYSILRAKGVPLGKTDYLQAKETAIAPSRFTSKLSLLLTHFNLKMRFIIHLMAIIGLAIATIATTPAKIPKDPEEILDKAIEALGGRGPVSKLNGVTYHVDRLMQSYNLKRTDVSVATSGSQNISFNLNLSRMRQRIDRRVQISNSWIWASPTLEPMDFSLVVHSGLFGCACYVRGNNQVFLPRNVTAGYVDVALAMQMVIEAYMMSPNLVYRLKRANTFSLAKVNINGIDFPAVLDTYYQITVIMDPNTYLPYIVRRAEEHPIYGSSTKDFYLSSYKKVQGIMFPHTIQTIYNSTTQNLNAVLEDFVIDWVTVDPQWPKNFFKTLDKKKSKTPQVMPGKVSGVSNGLVTDYSSSMVGSGVQKVDAKKLKWTSSDDLPQVHWLIIDDSEVGFKQLVLEFEEDVIVCDAPPQWSKIVMKWIKEKLNKKVTHVAMAVDYWSSIPYAKFVTFNQTHPYVHADNKIKAWFNWADQAPHAADWTYVVVTKPCAKADSPIIAYEADAWDPGHSVEMHNQAVMRQWLDQAFADGLPRHARVYPAHGQIAPFEQLINITAYPYPDYDVTNWRNGAALCERGPWPEELDAPSGKDAEEKGRN
ncbi:hypothetical protein F53441_9456 [Fusarium austroafricanum]|uniref:Uncharacterized protein n=1 Tax=Fusarium austroafricanum TaxID=2364996 RepID=A0A8H4NTB7_9HYPO|nr:hypothetical protein F53441_9456 [Fusarium austroafricanum]